MSDLPLLLASTSLDDIEHARIAVGNRLGAMEREGLADTPQYEIQAGMLEGLKAVEKESERALDRAFRQHPLAPWVKRTTGIGPKQGPRLIAAIGDPYIRGPVTDPDTDEVLEKPRPRRGPAELWAYCGYDPKQKRQRGVQSNWNSTAKMRARLCAENAVKAGVRQLPGCDDTDGYDVAHREAISPLGAVYLNARESWAARDVPDGHAHNHALRLVAKEILKDLFLEAKAVSNGR